MTQPPRPPPVVGYCCCGWKPTRLVAFAMTFSYVAVSLYLVHHTELIRHLEEPASPTSSAYHRITALAVVDNRSPPRTEEFSSSSSSSSSPPPPSSSGPCVVIGIFSRESEHDLRRWQRSHFAEFWHNQRHRPRPRHRHHGSTSSSVGWKNVRLLFPVAYKNNPALNELLYQEQQLHGDLIFLPITENYQWLTAATFEFFKVTVSLFDAGDRTKTSSHNDQSCPHGRYVVKADSDVVISYENLLAILRAVPSNQTVHLGQMQPDTPVHHPLIRRAGSLSLSTLPVWSVGQIYALSLDLVQTLIRDDVMLTVLKADVGYVYPEEDRSIGLALQRAQIPVAHRIHLPYLYLFCQVQDLLVCGHLRDFTAIGVGFGLSGSDAVFKDGKLKLLEQVSRQARLCRSTVTTAQSQQRQLSTARPIDDQFVLIDEAFRRSPEPQQYFFDNCPSLSTTGELMKKEFLGDSKQADIDFMEKPRLERECSEAAYWRNHPQFKNETTSSRTESSARDHFLSTGSKEDKSSSYYCPEECFNATCTRCDREAAYIQSYPDIADAVQSGAFENGTLHFVKYGKDEGRVFPCFPRHTDHGYGSNQGCETIFQKFMNATRPAVATWPVFGKVPVGGVAASPNAIVFCEGRQNEWTDYVLRVARRFTGPDWLFYLVGPPSLTSFWKQHYTGPQIQIVTVPPTFGDLSIYPEQINMLYRSDFLWKDTVQRENILVIQSDALLLRHGVEDFFAYDYVGSPVYPESFPDMNWRILCARHFHCGGNGGLSFRKRSAMLYSLNHCNIPKDSLDEDQWYSACLAESGTMNLPHPIIANRFSMGSKCDVDVPFGIHKPWQNCKESTCMAALVESQLYADIYGDHHQSDDDQCEEGNAYYLLQNKDVAASTIDGNAHYLSYGKGEGRRWVCFDNVTKPQLRDGPYKGVPPAWIMRSGNSATMLTRINQNEATSPIR
jgi:Protein of unknown function (DUF5672)/Galactosyltransferase